MNETNALQTQIGGTHYKNLVMQPIEFIIKAKLSFIQGNIVKYITRYKNKNGKQDIEKCIHYAKLAIELNSSGPEYRMLNIAYTYCKVNNLSQAQTNIIVACVQDDYYLAIRYCNQLIKLEYENAG